MWRGALWSGGNQCECGGRCWDMGECNTGMGVSELEGTDIAEWCEPECVWGYARIWKGKVQGGDMIVEWGFVI